MIEQITFKNTNGETIDYNLDLLTIAPTDWKLPVHKFQTSGDVRNVKRTRAQEHGIFKTPTYIGAGTIHMEGDILALTVEEANATRKEYKRILLGDPLDVPVLRKMGDLYLTLQETGGETYTTAPTGCMIEGYPEVIMSNENPTVQPFLITFVCFLPYLIGQSSGQPYWL